MVSAKAKYKNILSQIRRNKSVCFNLAIRFTTIDKPLAFNYLALATSFYFLIEAIESNSEIVTLHPHSKQALYNTAKKEKNPNSSVAYYTYKFYDLSEQISDLIINRKVVN